MARKKGGGPGGRPPGARKRTDKGKPPGSPQEAWEQAVAAYQEGRPERAQQLLAPLLDLPSVPGEVSLLAGLVEAELGDAPRAEAHLQRGLKLVPGRKEGWLGLANVQHMQGRFDAAIGTYRRVLRSEPDEPTALYNLAMTFMEYGRHRDALDTFDRVLAVAPDWPGAAHNRAVVLNRLGWFEETRAAYESLLSRHPDDPLLRLEFAQLLERANRSDEAERWLPGEAELAGQPRARAQAEGLRAQFQARRGDHAGALERVRAARRETGQDFLGYREGSYLDRLGHPDEAMEAFAAANRALLHTPLARRLLGRGYAELVQARVERGLPADDTAPDADDPDGRRTPVFLVGLPRSGTTLLDRMLGAHPETTVLEEFDSVRAIEGARTAGCSRAEARRAYWDYVDRHVAVDRADLLIDKNPMHIPHLDSLPWAFPEAKVVIALRHPYDAALSCYMQHFDLNPATVHFLELDSTGVLCSRMLRLLRQFAHARPGQAVHVRYEDVVADFQGELTRVLQAIGLDWHEDVAAYAERADDLVTTPSYDQVTRELYRSSIGRWQRYRDWIGPLREHIGPLLAELGYDERASA